MSDGGRVTGVRVLHVPTRACAAEIVSMLESARGIRYAYQYNAGEDHDRGSHWIAAYYDDVAAAVRAAIKVQEDIANLLASDTGDALALELSKSRQQPDFAILAAEAGHRAAVERALGEEERRAIEADVPAEMLRAGSDEWREGEGARGRRDKRKREGAQDDVDVALKAVDDKLRREEIEQRQWQPQQQGHQPTASIVPSVRTASKLPPGMVPNVRKAEQAAPQQEATGWGAKPLGIARQSSNAPPVPGPSQGAGQSESALADQLLEGLLGEGGGAAPVAPTQSVLPPGLGRNVGNVQAAQPQGWGAPPVGRQGSAADAEAKAWGSYTDKKGKKGKDGRQAAAQSGGAAATDGARASAGAAPVAPTQSVLPPGLGRNVGNVQAAQPQGWGAPPVGRQGSAADAEAKAWGSYTGKKGEDSAGGSRATAQQGQLGENVGPTAEDLEVLRIVVGFLRERGGAALLSDIGQSIRGKPRSVKKLIDFIAMFPNKLRREDGGDSGGKVRLLP